MYADLSGRSSLRVPGPQTEEAVPLIKPTSDASVTFTPETVTARFKVQQADQRYRRPTMPVWVAAPPLLAERGYKVVLLSPPNLSNVNLIGPPELIEALQKDLLKPIPKAYIEVTLDDLPVDVPKTREVKYELPRGIEVAPEDRGRTVEFKLERINQRE